MGRVSTFADPAVLKMTQTDFVPVCTDDWYTRRRKDSEGEFFRTVADQSPRKGLNGATRQGIYLFTADGELLGFKNHGGDAGVMKKVFTDAKAKFDKLPLARRKAGAVTVPDAGKPDAKYHHELPEDGIILKVHGRILEAKAETFVKGKCTITGGDQASRDYCWISADEKKSLIPSKSEVGFRYALPEKIAERLARFHLIDNTRGEPEFWKKGDVRKSNITLTVTVVKDDAIELRLDGELLLSSEADSAKSKVGFEPKLSGSLRYIPSKNAFVLFDVVAVGDYWGHSAYTPGSRAGRTPFGVSIGLADVTKPSERIYPQGLRESEQYYGGK